MFSMRILKLSKKNEKQLKAPFSSGPRVTLLYPGITSPKTQVARKNGWPRLTHRRTLDQGGAGQLEWHFTSL